MNDLKPELVDADLSQVPAYLGQEVDPETRVSSTPPDCRVGVPVEDIEKMWLSPMPGLNRDGEIIPATGLIAVVKDGRFFCLSLAASPCFLPIIPLN